MFAGDLVNPDVLSQLGLDSLLTARGTVLVAFNNTTRFPAYFTAFYSQDAQDLTVKSRNFGTLVEARSVRNEVLQCPVGLVSPGILDSDYTINTLAATINSTITTTTGATSVSAEVAYEGVPVQVGTAFFCGDVIEIRLTEQATATGGTGGTQALFVVSLRVIPGE
jgi:hypothetical protein